VIPGPTPTTREQREQEQALREHRGARRLGNRSEPVDRVAAEREYVEGAIGTGLDARHHSKALPEGEPVALGSAIGHQVG